MKTTPEQRAKWARIAESRLDVRSNLERQGRISREAIPTLLADLEEARIRIHDLETICDPAGLTIENAQSKDQLAALQIMYRNAADDLAATRKQLAEAQALIPRFGPLLINAGYVGANREIQRELQSIREGIVSADTSALSAAIEAARREGEDRVIDKLLAAQANENAARSMCEDFRRQLAEAQAENAAMHSAAHRLALEAECFYMDCKDMALVSKWDDPLQTAISDVQAIRWDGDTSALSAAIAEAVEPYKLDADRYQQLRRGQHWSVINGIGEDLRADELDAAIDAIAAKEAP